MGIHLQRALIKSIMESQEPAAHLKQREECLVFLFSALQRVVAEPRKDGLFFYCDAIMGVIMNQKFKKNV